MKRHIDTLSLLCMLFYCVTSVFAQQPAGRGGGRGQAPQPPPLFFKETWKQAPGNVPVTQEFVVNPDLKLNIYGAGKEDFRDYPFDKSRLPILVLPSAET